MFVPERWSLCPGLTRLLQLTLTAALRVSIKGAGEESKTQVTQEGFFSHWEAGLPMYP